MPSMGSSLVAVALFLCANRGTGKQSFNADAASGMLAYTSPVPGNAEAVPASGVAVWGSKESLRTETLLASFSPETPSSWGPSVRHLPWGTSFMISYLISLEDLTQNQEVSVSFIVTFVLCFFCFQESYWQLLAMSQKEFALTFSLSMEE